MARPRESSGKDPSATARPADVPFWLAGGQASPERISQALELGAAGVQVGTAFASCEESGLSEELKRRVPALSEAGRVRAFTDPRASPTGFPFKVVHLEGSASDPAVCAARTSTCDLGYLREAYRRPDGGVGWRCAAEPLEDYLRKGGSEETARGRKCVCNALMANIGLPQVRRDGAVERPLVTSGDDVATVARFLRPGARSDLAAALLSSLLSGRQWGCATNA